MVFTLLGRALRALPVYLLGVLMVLGISQVLGTSTVIAATDGPADGPAGAPQGVPSLQLPLHLTIVVGTLPIPVVLPTRID